jgi:hypothetical protein
MSTEVQPVSDVMERERTQEEVGRFDGSYPYESQRAHDDCHRPARTTVQPPEPSRTEPRSKGASPPTESLKAESLKAESLKAESLTETGLVTEVESSTEGLPDSSEPFRVMEPLRKKSERPDAVDSVVIRRSLRLEQKAKLADQLLQNLPENDRRRRLLRAAIVRRDEVLLDGFIAELGG